jgi:hypothetical protein
VLLLIAFIWWLIVITDPVASVAIGVANVLLMCCYRWLILITDPVANVLLTCC